MSQRRGLQVRYLPEFEVLFVGQLRKALPESKTCSEIRRVQTNVQGRISRSILKDSESCEQEEDAERQSVITYARPSLTPPGQTRVGQKCWFSLITNCHCSRPVRTAYEVYAVESPVLGGDFMKVPRKIGLCFSTERSLVYSDHVYRLPPVGNCRAQMTQRFVPRGRSSMAVLLYVSARYVA